MKARKYDAWTPSKEVQEIIRRNMHTTIDNKNRSIGRDEEKLEQNLRNAQVELLIHYAQISDEIVRSRAMRTLRFLRNKEAVSW